MIDTTKEWQGMPEFVQTPKVKRKLIVLFEDESSVDAFAARNGFKLTPKTKTVWYKHSEPVH